MNSPRAAPALLDASLMSGIDAAYGIPTGVHRSQIITDSQGAGQLCPTTNKPIHKTSKAPTSTAMRRTCTTRTSSAAACSAPPGASSQTSYPPSTLRRTSTGTHQGRRRVGVATLMRLFNFLQPALSPAQLQRLKAQAKSQGNYWTSSTGWTSPNERQAVMYFDLTKTDLGGVVDLNDIGPTPVNFGRAPGLSANDPACDDRSLIIVIEGGNAKLNSNQKLTASLFLTAAAPNGKLMKANGTSDYIGTIYADRADLTGNANLSMDDCFLSNPSSANVQLTETSYRELDR